MIVTSAFLDAFAQAWNWHDTEAIVEMMTPDCVLCFSAGATSDGSRFEGREAVRAAIEDLFARMPDAQWQGARHFISGDRGVTEWTMAGHDPGRAAHRCQGVRRLSLQGRAHRVQGFLPEISCLGSGDSALVRQLTQDVGAMPRHIRACTLICSVCWVGVYAYTWRRGSSGAGRGAEPTACAVVSTSGPACSFAARLAQRLEAEHDRWFLWLPVLFGAGIAFYFALPSEPLLLVAVLPAIAALAIHVAGPRTGLLGLTTAAMLAVTLGLAAAKLRTEIVRAPVLQARVGPIDIYGHVELVEPRAAEGQRLTIRVTAMEKHEAQAWPARVRVRMLAENAALKPGDPVHVKATLSPPPGPALPGDYDFARAAWFQGLGAVGLRQRRGEDRAECRASRRCRCGERGDRARAPGDRPACRGGAAGRDRRHRQRADHGRARRHHGRPPTRRSATPACSTSCPSPACTW